MRGTVSGSMAGDDSEYWGDYLAGMNLMYGTPNYSGIRADAQDNFDFQAGLASTYGCTVSPRAAC